jgi:hypothetical protein
LIHDPATTTCKYLHRKDLPYFLVDEGLREHAAEFARYPALANLHTGEPISRAYYVERRAWETKSFDGLVNAIANYHKSKPPWIFIETLTGGIDGRRSLAHASLTRRYLAKCSRWQSSYRLVLAVVQDLSVAPSFKRSDFVGGDEVEEEAFWDTIFCRLSLVQEYGWHSGIEKMRWVPDYLGDAIVTLDWPGLQGELEAVGQEITSIILEHAKEQGEYFGLDTDPEEAV